tara:strand:- start:799 stop:966 length:168 start_codon:yes stop_codon:yes gene_type:complete
MACLILIVMDAELRAADTGMGEDFRKRFQSPPERDIGANFDVIDIRHGDGKPLFY